jgi:L,D-transpeptidase catalytic domain
VRKIYLPLSIACLLMSFTLLSFKSGSNKKVATVANVKATTRTVTSEASAVEAASNLIYDSLHLNDLGLSKEALLYAYEGEQTLEEKGVVNNSGILTVCDFSQPSNRKRMYIIDVKNFRVLLNTYVAHGKNSGFDYADRFSNRPESLQSSLGFYITKNTYIGKHGLSLRLAGLDKGLNDNAEERAVVVHGAEYVGDQRTGAGYMGRSFGCPAVPQQVAPKVIDYIKNGTCLFIYHPSENYLQESTVLNG